MTIRDFEESMDYGIGYNSLSGKVRGNCVQRTPAEALDGGKGQKVFFRHHLVKNSSELSKCLELSASASINAKWFTEASGKAHFLTGSKINQYSVYLLVQVMVTNSRLRMRDISLTAEAIKLLETKGNEAFRERGGDEFVVGLITGGEYLGLLEVESKTEEQKREISAFINIQAPMWNIEAEFKNSMSELASRYSVKIKNYQAGGLGDQIPKTVEEMVERAVNFPKIVQGDAAIAYKAIFSDYTTLDLPDEANLIDITHQKDVLMNLWKWRLKYMETLSNIEYVLQNPQQFEQFSDEQAEQLNAKANEIRNLIDEITQSASNCANNINACKLPNNIIQPIVKLPKRRERHTLPKPSNLQERLFIEAGTLDEIGFENVEFKPVKDGYGLELLIEEDFFLVFFIPQRYPHQPPTVAIKTSSSLEEIYFENGTWQSDLKIADIVLSFKE